MPSALRECLSVSGAGVSRPARLHSATVRYLHGNRRLELCYRLLLLRRQPFNHRIWRLRRRCAFPRRSIAYFISYIVGQNRLFLGHSSEWWPFVADHRVMLTCVKRNNLKVWWPSHRLWRSEWEGNVRWENSRRETFGEGDFQGKMSACFVIYLRTENWYFGF